ncbi:hypothetical protein ACG02S_00850 [Roseateles sp. DC23W]|uniref:Uncharacterized protein n=1 Tax=Pelomonas dachongensis TaxID=3299029 RepID=A0ABW7EG53_9BURK
MTSAVLKWIANGVIGLVALSTLWIAQTVQPGRHEVMSLLVAQAVAAPAAAASAPVTR